MGENKAGYSVEGNTLIINRELTELDLFVRDFLDVLKRHSGYLIVSGFVSISSGRARGTEDVDILVKVMDEKRFTDLFEALNESGFWCYQGDKADEAFQYHKDMLSIRFARNKEIFPNIEFIPVNETRPAQLFEFNHPQRVKVQDFEFKIPPIEFEILYKEIVLGSDKDIADAKHLRTFFAEIIKEEAFKEFKEIVKRGKR